MRRSISDINMHLLELICSHSGGYAFPPAAAAMNQTALTGVLMKIRSGISPSERVIKRKRKKKPTEEPDFALLPPPPPKNKSN